MRTRLAALLRSAVEWFEKGSPMRSEHAPSRQELRTLVLEILSEQTTAREEAAQLARAAGVEGGNPPTAGVLPKFTGSQDVPGLGESIVEEDSGKIGIGTTSPQTALQVDSSASDLLRLNRTGTGAVDFKVSAGMAGSAMDLVVDPAQASSGFLFRPRNSANEIVNGLGIDRNGNVGIGTTSPNEYVEILRKAGSTITRPLLKLQSQTSGSVDGDSFIIYGTETANWSAGVDQADSNKFRIEPTTTLGGSTGIAITTGGNVGIGTPSPLNKVHVEGGNVQIGSPTGDDTQWRTLLLGTSAPKQQSFGPEMITAAAKNDDDPVQHRRVVLWAGREDQSEAMFLLNSTGLLEWGPGGTEFPRDDQDSSLGRNAVNGEMALINDKAFVVGRSALKGGAELLRVNTDPDNTNFIVNINGAGSSATLDVKSHSTTKPTVRAGQSEASLHIFGGHVQGEQQLRFVIAANGKVSWGPGMDVSTDIDLLRFAGGDPLTKGLQLAGGDLYVSTLGKGVILKDSDGKCWRLKVSTAGVPTAEALTACP